ncbi:hypothetical protein M8494_21600 [Serratia ureilytica]
MDHLVTAHGAHPQLELQVAQGGGHRGLPTEADGVARSAVDPRHRRAAGALAAPSTLRRARSTSAATVAGVSRRQPGGRATLENHACRRCAGAGPKSGWVGRHIALRRWG